MTFRLQKLNLKYFIRDRIYTSYIDLFRKDKPINVDKLVEEILSKIKYETQKGVEEYFPKGKSKERGAALMLIASLFKEENN